MGGLQRRGGVSVNKTHAYIYTIEATGQTVASIMPSSAYEAPLLMWFL